MKKIPYIALLLSTLLLSSGLGNSATVPQENFTNKQILTSKKIVNELTYDHYSKRVFNDKMSSELFDNYLSKLDPRKQTFTQADIKKFESQRTQLDNQIKKGDLTFSYQVFELFKARLKSQLEGTLANWPKAIRNLNFNANDSILINREDAVWPKDQKEVDSLWQKNLKAMVLNLELSDKKPDEIEKVLQKRLQRQLKNLLKKDSSDVFQIYMNSLTELYDPHTNYLSPQNAETFNINMSLKLQGIGAVLQNKDEEVNVVSLVAAGPADKQGELQPNDRIVAVGQGTKGEMVDVVGWELDDVVDLIRGKPKSVVRLDIMRGSGSTLKSKQISITRDNVKLEDQSAKKAIVSIPDSNGLPQKVGVIKIPTFYMDFDAARRGDKEYKSTTRDVFNLIKELEKDNIKGLIIDLRDNGGGSLPEAQQLTSLFIEQGPVVQIKQSNGRVNILGKSLRSGYYTGPIVVLIDRLSASASEIFAAAIQDYDRGLIIGDQSYGKGTVQTLKPLLHGELKITESKFYRISGESTQHRGVLPDIQLPPLYDKEEIGENTQEHALPWDKIANSPHTKYLNFKNILPALNTQHKNRMANDPDFVFQNAILKLNDKNEKYLSLNRETRKAKNKTQDKQLLDLENVRRKAKNEKTLTSLSELEEEESKKNRTNNTVIDTEKDFYLREAANVVLDSNNLLRKNCVSKEAPHCQTPIMRNIMSDNNILFIK